MSVCDAAVAEILGVIDDLPRPPRLIGIDGPSGAGKSTLASALVDEMPMSSCVVEGDDFYRGLSLAASIAIGAVGGADQYFEWERLLSQVIAPFCARESRLRYQRYDWEAGALDDWVDRPSPDCLIIEGVYTLRPQLREWMDLKIFVTASETERLRRQRERRQNPEEWIRLWGAAEHYYLTSAAPQKVADVVCDLR